MCRCGMPDKSGDLEFKRIKRVILFGGSRLLARAAVELSGLKDYEIVVFSSPRHLNGLIDGDNTLKAVLAKHKVAFFSEEDINSSVRVGKFIDSNTLGVAMGASWVFQKSFVRRFANPLLDFMGIDLPRYRGGAHYTWQILFSNKKGCCNLQIIYGGKGTFHKGPVIKHKVYRLSSGCRLPVDYFREALPVEMDFLLEFLREAKQGRIFKMHRLDESKSTYFPFLHTLSNGWIDWSWSADEIVRFICAFDDPYGGASTRHNGKRVLLKGADIEKKDRMAHPFAAGLIIHKNDKFIKVMARGGILRISGVTDIRKNPAIKKIKPGDRFISLHDDLERASGFKAEYSAGGLKK